MNSSRRRRRPRAALAAGLLVIGAAAMAPSALASPPSGLPVDLEITKTADKASYAPGDVVTYTVIIFNGGTTAVPLDRIRVNDPLVTLVPQRNPTVLAPLTSLRFVGTYTVKAADCGRLPNTVTVEILPPTGSQPPLVDADLSNNTAGVTVDVQGEACAPPVTPPVTPPPAPTPPPSVSGPPAPPAKVDTKPVCPLPKLSTSISGNPFVLAGNVARYRVVVRNAPGSNASLRTKARIAMPAGFSLVNRPKSIAPKGRTLGVSLGTLAPGGSRTVLVSLRADATVAGPRVVTVTVTGKCGQAANDTARTLVGAIGPRVQPAVTG